MPRVSFVPLSGLIYGCIYTYIHVDVYWLLLFSHGLLKYFLTLFLVSRSRRGEQGARRHGEFQTLTLIKQGRHSIPDIRHGENQGLRILGSNEKNWNRWGENHTQLGTNEDRNRKTKYGHERRGKHVTWGTQVWQYSPLPNGASRTEHHPTGRGGGRSGGLKGHVDRTGQEASRAAPVLGAMAGQGAREAMAEQGAREAMAEQGAREAMAEQGAREAMAEQGAWEAMVGPPPRPRPSPHLSPLWPEPYDHPPPQISLGKIGAPSDTWGWTGGMDSWVRSGSADSWGRSAGAGTWGRSAGAGTWGRSAGAGTRGRSTGADTRGRWRGAGSGVRWRGAGSGVRWRGAGSGVRTGGHLRGAGTGGHLRGAGTGGDLRGAGTGGHLRGAASWGALESWTEPAGALESWTGPAGALEGLALEKRALEGLALEKRALEDAIEERALERTCDD